jgi:hypothetical protein
MKGNKKYFIFPGTQFWSVTVPKYLNYAAFWKDLLLMCIRCLQYWKRFRRTDARNVGVIDLSLLISKTADKMF